MGLINNVRNFFSKDSESITRVDNPVVEYVGELSKQIVKGSSAQIERHGDHAIITYSGENMRKMPVRNSILGGNTTRSNTTKLTLLSDYDFARIERFYEKEGLLRRFVVTATARALRGEFSLVPNKSYTGDKKKAALFKAEVRTILKESQMTWLSFVQTLIKEIHIYGNTLVRKYRKEGRLIRLLSDDPLFYRVIIDPKSLLVTKYVRQARLRPRAWSEDTYNNSKTHFGIYPQFVGSDFTGRRYLQSLGYYGSTIGQAAPAPETIALEDMVHIKYMVEKNAPFAMPPGMPILNDIEDMRVLEENLVFLGWQFGHPILVATVDCTGMTEAEAQAEINRTRNAIDNMESIGFIVGTHRLKIELKYPNGSGVPLNDFVNYLNKRISKNMDTAALLMGDGGDAGRQAGEAIEASSNDIIWMTSMIIKEALEEQLLRDIWVSNLGGTDIDEMPLKVRLVEIDRAKYSSYVNQLNNLMTAKALPPSRVLDRIGEEPLSEAEKKEIQEYSDLMAGPEPKNVNPRNQHGEQTPGSKKD